jgi:lantibiotic modifying enzyme
VEKLRDQKTQNMNLYDNILEVLAYESFERVRAYAKEIINSFSSGVENKILHVCVSSLIPNFNINIKENRREIAEQAYHEKGYFS